MLRITVHHTPGSLTFQLEGRLAGPWAHEAKACWQRMLADHDRTAARVDLTGVTVLDAAGKALLAAMHAQGVEFAVAGCLMKAIVAEITRAPTCARGRGNHDKQPD
jgi:anti-anti-sigma regulatory factor